MSADPPRSLPPFFVAVYVTDDDFVYFGQARSNAADAMDGPGLYPRPNFAGVLAMWADGPVYRPVFCSADEIGTEARSAGEAVSAEGEIPDAWEDAIPDLWVDAIPVGLAPSEPLLWEGSD